MGPKTPLARLVDRLLRERGTDLGAWLRARREVGLAWRQIARDLEAETGVEVSYESLRRWSTQR